MPRKHSVKQYVKNAYYHVYNRGVDKRDIFIDEQDYSVFLRFLKEYLLPENHPDLQKLHDLQGSNPRRSPINCHQHIKLLTYCLMPNHFHLFIKQKSHEGLKPFMKALSTNFSMYFNKKYKRIGPLFQGVYKAIMITKDSYLLHISRYIHLNPFELLSAKQSLKDYPYSSYKYYLSPTISPLWLDAKEILKLFELDGSLANTISSYKDFVENYQTDEILEKKIKHFSLE